MRKRRKSQNAPTESGSPIRSRSRLIGRGAQLLTIFQTIDNACATIAMLNIVNNIQGIELGENLQAFKDFTKDFTPPLRGDAIANFQFVKEIHNSFARSVLSSTARICMYYMSAVFDASSSFKLTLFSSA